MATPDPRQVKQAFENKYYAEHKTLEGVGDAYLWWQNPALECAVLAAGRGGNKCKTPCEFCLNRVVRKVA